MTTGERQTVSHKGGLALPRKVLSLGQCAADHYTLTQYLENAYGVEVVPADTARDALDELQKGPCALVLVNRILDRDGDSGLDFIRRLKEDAGLAATPVMLVSNYSDAQQQAIALGALAGFGKASLGDARTSARLAAVLRSG